MRPIFTADVCAVSDRHRIRAPDGSMVLFFDQGTALKEVERVRAALDTAYLIGQSAALHKARLALGISQPGLRA